MGSKKINYEFKVLYAIAIIMVVSSHCYGGGISLGYEWFSPTSCMLALFMFSSGFFYDPACEQHMFQSLFHKCKKLLLPMYLWNLFYGILVWISQKAGFQMGSELTIHNLIVEPWITGHQFIYNLGGWFFCTLFLVYLINMGIRKLLGKLPVVNDYILEILYLAIGMAGIYAAMQGWNQGIRLAALRVAFFLPIYGFGILYKTRLSCMDFIPNHIYFGVVFGIQLIILTINGEAFDFVPVWCSNFKGVLLPYIASLTGICFYLRIARIMAPVIGHNKYLLLIADHTYDITIHQFLGFMMVKGIFAVGCKFFGVFSNFSFSGWKTDIWYYYLPRDIRNWYTVYLAAGIIVPIIIAKGIGMVKQKLLLRAER